MGCASCGCDHGSVPPEPPVGTWVMDRWGGVHYHQVQGGWGLPGFWPLGRWAAMWESRGPLTECGPHGRPLEPSAKSS